MAESYFVCAICLEFSSDSPSKDYFVSTPGGHVFHYLCIRQHLENSGENGGEEGGCPLCREPLSIQNLTRLYGIKLKKSSTSVKLRGDGSDGTLPSLKLVLLGNSTVGKTSVIRRVSNQSYVESLNPTCGCDVVFRNIVIGGRVYRVNMWDTAGQENFKSVVSTTLRGANAVVLVYDVTNPQSLNDIEAWLEFSYKYCDEDCLRVLIGNKIDLEGGRRVSKLVGEALSQKLSLNYYETSAKTGENIEPTLRSIVGLVLEKPLNNSKETNLVELLVEEGVGSSKCGC